MVPIITHTNTSTYAREASRGTSDGAGSSNVGYNKSKLKWSNNIELFSFVQNEPISKVQPGLQQV
jgi:hypothetical protein